MPEGHDLKSPERTYFRMIKRRGIGLFVEKCLFRLNSNESVKINFQLGGIQPARSFLDYPSALLANKDALLKKGRGRFKE